MYKMNVTLSFVIPVKVARLIIMYASLICLDCTGISALFGFKQLQTFGC